MANFSVDAVVILLLFLISAPALVIQFAEPEVRYVLTHHLKELTWKNMILPGLLGFGVAIFIYVLAFLLGVYRSDSILPGILLLLLFGLIFYVVFYFLPLTQKQNVIKHFTHKIVRSVRVQGQFNEDDLNAITLLGIDSQAGDEKTCSIQALGEIALVIVQRADYQGRQIELPVESLRKVLFYGKQKGSPENFRFAVDVLQSVIQAYDRKVEGSSTFSDIDLRIVYQFLSQIALEAITFQSEGVVSACIAAIKEPKTTKSTFSWRLCEIGTAAVLNDRMVSALEALHVLETIIETNEQSSNDVLFDTMGLFSAFWQHGESTQKMIKVSLDKLKNKPTIQIRKLIGQSIQHHSHAAHFTTADRIRNMWDAYLRLP